MDERNCRADFGEQQSVLSRRIAAATTHTSLRQTPAESPRFDSFPGRRIRLRGIPSLRRRNPVATMIAIAFNSSPLRRATRLAFKSTPAISMFVQRSNSQSFGLLDKPFAQLAAVRGVKTEIVVDRMLNRRSCPRTSSLCSNISASRPQSSHRAPPRDRRTCADDKTSWH